MNELELCNGGCNQIRPVYKWMKAAFDKPYPYCEECFPKNWIAIDAEKGIYELIDRPTGYWETDEKGMPTRGIKY